MSPGRASPSYGVRTFATTLIHCYRASSMTAASNPGNQHIGGSVWRSLFRYGSQRHHALSFSSGSLIERPESKMEHESNLKVQPSDPDPPRDNIFSWVKWVLGSMLPIIFAFWKQKWDSMLKLEGKVEGVVKEVEEVAEVVEKVASKTEKLSAEVAERLNNGELKEVALKVEHVSNVIAKDARLTEDFIQKVGDLKKDLTNLEAMVEPAIDKWNIKSRP